MRTPILFTALFLGGCDLLDELDPGTIKDSVPGFNSDTDEQDPAPAEDNADCLQPWFADIDGDGVGDGTHATEACEAPSAGWVAVSGDCDDNNADVYPGVPERCDGIDTDCDPATAEDGLASRVEGGAYIDVTESLRGEGSKILRGEHQLCGGTWAGPFVLTGTTSLVGEGAVVDAGGAATAIVVSDGADVALSGLVVTGGEGGELDGGGGIRCEGSASLSLSSVEIADNHSGVGGGLWSDACTIAADNVEIYGNTAEYGAGILAWEGSVTLRDSRITENTATVTGGGMYLEGEVAPLSVTLDGVLLDGNVATYAGAAFLSGDIGAVLVDTVIEGNTAEAGAGVLLYELADDARADLRGCAFSDNVIEDIHVVGAYWYTNLGSGYSATCDAAGCVP